MPVYSRKEVIKIRKYFEESFLEIYSRPLIDINNKQGYIKYRCLHPPFKTELSSIIKNNVK